TVLDPTLSDPIVRLVDRRKAETSPLRRDKSRLSPYRSEARTVLKVRSRLVGVGGLVRSINSSAFRFFGGLEHLTNVIDPLELCHARTNAEPFESCNQTMANCRHASFWYA